MLTVSLGLGCFLHDPKHVMLLGSLSEGFMPSYCNAQHTDLSWNNACVIAIAKAM
jgi:hypothetical protein